MSTVRLRRLRADRENLQDYARRHPRITVVSAEGDPPERYQLGFQLRSLRQVNGELIEVTDHLIEVYLPAQYPRLPPQCRMLTPIFHPNIAPHAICIGDHWSAGEPLWSIVSRIGEMIAYQSYNTKSPLNGEAARWVAEHIDLLPLDPVSLLVEERRDAFSGAAADERLEAVMPVSDRLAPAAANGPNVDAETFVICTGCEAKLRITAALRGKRVRCPKCRTIVPVPSGDVIESRVAEPDDEQSPPG
jgi:ubiquitin-protein ligase